MASSTRATLFFAPNSICSQSLAFGDSYAVHRLFGVGLKFRMPSLACSTLSNRDVNDAVTFGNALPPGLKARLPAGGGAGATGRVASPHASNSVSPVLPLLACVNRARSLLVLIEPKNSNWLAHLPAGLAGVRVTPGTPSGRFLFQYDSTSFQELPFQYSRSTFCGGTIFSPSSRK